MLEAFVLTTLVITSAGAYVVGTRRLGLTDGMLRLACRKTAEILGLTVLFFLLNLVTGLVIVLAVRGLTRHFLSAYLLDDAVWLFLAFLQALTFGWWRQLSPPR